MNRRKFLIGAAAMAAVPAIPLDDGLAFPIIHVRKLNIPKQIDLGHYAIGAGVISMQILGEWHDLGECSGFTITRTENEQA